MRTNLHHSVSRGAGAPARSVRVDSRLSVLSLDISTERGASVWKRALNSNANILISGDRHAAFNAIVGCYSPRNFRVLTADQWNSEPLERLMQGSRDDPIVLFLKQVHRLNRQAQIRLLDVLEDVASNGPGRPLVRRLVSTCRGDLESSVRAGAFSHSLYLRLSTLRFHIPFGWRGEGNFLTIGRVRT